MSDTKAENALFLTVVAPALNEEAVIGEFCRTTLAVADSDSRRRWEILIVDDGSSDTTADIVRALRREDSRVCLLSLTRSFGQEAAIVAGLSHARDGAVVVMDADLQDPPELIPRMLAKMDEGYEMVAGKYRREGEGWFKKFSAAVFYRMLRALSGDYPPPADVNNFRLLSRRAVRAFLAMPERGRYARGMFAWLGMRYAEIEFARPPRAQGETKYTLARMCGLGLSGITSFSSAPLHWSLYLGCAAVLSSLACFVYIFRALIIGVAVPGWASILGAVLILGGVQLLVLGVIGEYLGKALHEVKRRPLYVRREFCGNREISDDE